MGRNTVLLAAAVIGVLAGAGKMALEPGGATAGLAVQAAPVLALTDPRTTPHPEDAGVLAAVEGLYAVISGEAGAERDWDAFRGMFVDERASMTVFQQRQGEDGEITVAPASMTPQDYIDRAGAWFEETAFFERGVSNRIEVYGRLAHVWSTYEARHDAQGEPFVRGINSITLVRGGDDRWRVLNLAWEDERSAGQIPERYLP